MLTEPYWSLQKGESSIAFHAFVMYRDCEDENPPVERSKQMVAARLSKSLTLIKRWAKVWRWDERIGHYERYKDSEVPSFQGRKFLRFLERFYDVYERLGEDRPTQEVLAIFWGLADSRSLRKKIRQHSVPGFKVNHRMLIWYCRCRKWIEDHPLADPRLAEIEINFCELPDYLWFSICLERILLGLSPEPPAGANSISFRSMSYN